MFRKKPCRAVLSALLLAGMLLLLVCTAFATGTTGAPTLPDPERTCSITVRVLSTEGKAIPGGTLRAAKAVGVDADGRYVLTPAFADSGLDLKKSYFSEDDVQLMVDFAAAHDVKWTSSPVDDKGEALFAGLEPGIYLIETDVPPENFLPILPFLVMVPVYEDGAYSYDVTCSPKPVNLKPDLEVPLVAYKEVIAPTGSAQIKTILFSFILTPEKAGQPMPKGGDVNAVYDATGALTVSRTGAGAVDFGSFNFSADDAGKTYVYRLREKRGTVNGMTYDTTVFEISLKLYLNEKGELCCESSFKDEGGKLLLELRFRNEYNPPPPDIPSTGQLWWPVFLCGAVGIVFVMIGVFGRKRREETP